MPHDHSVADLDKCIKGCRNDQVCVKACEDAFVTAGGKVFKQDGGKVFTDRDGGKVFIPDPK